MKKCILIVCAIVLVFPAGVSFAGDAAAGKAKAVMCGGCHGSNGMSPSPLWPNLAGQKEQYFVKQMKAFKDGSRKDPMMAGQAAALSDADIENLAAYYASLPCK